jgi:hypothetical protein
LLSRIRRTQLITVLTPSPKRAAVARRDKPSTSTERTARSRKSIE